MSRLEGLRVLVVEDEALIALMIEDMLTDAGCIVAGTAPDTSGALAVVGTELVDVVILDIHLTDGDSYGVADEVLRRGTPIIFCTGDRPMDILPPYSGEPCLTKPFSASDLARELDRAVGARRPAP